MSDWDSDNETTATSPPPKAAITKPAKSRFAGEDEEEDSPASDWEESSEEEEAKPKATSAAAPIKKKGTLKQKIAEKEAAKAARRDSVQDSDEEEYDSDDILDPREKARRDKERELNADLDNAAALLGSAALGGTSSKELDSLISADPRTKTDFEDLSARIIEYILKRHQNKPLYPSFVEHHTRALALPLKDVEVRKAASGLTTLANEKQKEAKDKASGKKKPKSAGKPGLGAARMTNKMDTNIYDEALDDFGTNADDFM